MTFRKLAALDEMTAAQVLADLCPGVADPQGEQALALGRRLGGLRLALHLAGNYLASPFARWHTFDEYRRALDSTDYPEALADLDASRAEGRAAIHQTWDLSLAALAADGRPHARHLLSLVSCYAPATPGPVNLLQAGMLSELLGERRPDDMDAMAGAAGSAHRLLREGLDGLAAAGLIDLADQGAAKVWAITVHPVVADHYPDLTRDAQRQLGLGPGPHHCLGAQLARMDIQVALSALLDRFPDLHLAVPADQVQWKARMAVRGPAALPIGWQARASPGARITSRPADQHLRAPASGSRPG